MLTISFFCSLSLHISDFCSKIVDSFSSNFETWTHVWSRTLLKNPPNTHSAWRSSVLTSACRLDRQLASQLQHITQHVNIPENVSVVQLDAAVVLTLQHHQHHSHHTVCPVHGHRHVTPQTSLFPSVDSMNRRAATNDYFHYWFIFMLFSKLTS